MIAITARLAPRGARPARARALCSASPPIRGRGPSRPRSPPRPPRHPGLGPLLPVAPRLLLGRAILFGAAASGPRAGDRAPLDDAVGPPPQHLGRGADEREIAEPQVVEVGRGIRHAQRAIGL